MSVRAETVNDLSRSALTKLYRTHSDWMPNEGKWRHGGDKDDQASLFCAFVLQWWPRLQKRQLYHFIRIYTRESGSDVWKYDKNIMHVISCNWKLGAGKGKIRENTWRHQHSRSDHGDFRKGVHSKKERVQRDVKQLILRFIQAS